MGKRAFQAPRQAALLILPLLAGLVALWIRFAPPANTSVELGLRMELPIELGPFNSQAILHCQNDPCRRSFPVNVETDLTICPVCGGQLGPIARSERDVLPPDTRIVRRIYQSPGSPSYTVMIVLAGADQRSIHRPQQCLPAQGFNIDRQHTESLSLAPGRALNLEVIDSRRDAGPLSLFGFAYWFVGPDMETHSHYVRLFWTTYDRLFRNRISRWAYVAITASEPLNSPESLERLASFLRFLAPAIEPHPPAPS